MKYLTLKSLAIASLLVGCVPAVGDYSEFSVRQRSSVTGQGQGQLQFAEGRYEGEIRDDRPQGNGRFEFKDGSVYSGEFVQGRAQGNGEHRYADGRVVRGLFAGDNPLSVTLSYPDGRLFEGKVAQGRAAGTGTMTLASGESLTGTFVNDQAQGIGLLSQSDGKPIYSGSFKDGKPHGEGLCAGPGGVQACVRENGRDITSQARTRQALELAERTINSEQDSSLKQIRAQYEPQTRQAQSQIDAVSSQQQQWRGPQSGDPCHCAITGMCLMLEDPDTTAEQRRINNLRWERRKLECRQQYSDYLGYKTRPDYSAQLSRLDSEMESVKQRYAGIRAEQRRKETEVERQRQARLADQAEKTRLADQLRRQEEAKREAELEKRKARCGDERFRRANPCGCAAALQRPLSKGGACEA